MYKLTANLNGLLFVHVVEKCWFFEVRKEKLGMSENVIDEGSLISLLFLQCRIYIGATGGKEFLLFLFFVGAFAVFFGCHGLNVRLAYMPGSSPLSI